MKDNKGKEKNPNGKKTEPTPDDELDDFIRKKKMQNKVLQGLIEKLKNSK